MHKNTRLTIFSIGLLLSLTVGFKQDRLPRLQLFLLIGQSNMAGRGAVDTQDSTPNARIWMLTKEQTWVPAHEPLHFDKPALVGVGPGFAFARKVAEALPDQTIGLIPCAVGGSGIDVWVPGAYYEPTKSHPYDDALQRARKALASGQLAGILWHQGESDSRADKAGVYEQKLTELIGRLRKDLHAETVPVLVGTLGDFYVQKNPAAASINAVLTRLPGRLPNVYGVSASGLVHKGDTTHFDAASARALGYRYADVYLKSLRKR